MEKRNIELKKKIVLAGVNKLTPIVMKMVNQEECEIIACIDLKGNYHGKKINTIPIIELNDLLYINHDHLILLDQFNEYEWSDKTIDLYEHLNTYFEYEFYENYYGFQERKEQIKGIITGISYHEVGLNHILLEKEFHNFALSSQDLFHDYQIAKFVLEQNPNIEEFIIGLSYYSFQYKLSKSRLKYRCKLYAPLINNLNQSAELERFRYFENRIKNILEKNYMKIYFDCVKERSEAEIKAWRNRQLSSEEKSKGKVTAQQDSNKNYPETVRENQEIFRMYLELLKKFNIKPVILICPVSKYYGDHFSVAMRTEFYHILNQFHQSYDFKILDLFSDRTFQDKDFYDVSHLNLGGQYKLTTVLNKMIFNTEANN